MHSRRAMMLVAAVPVLWVALSGWSAAAALNNLFAAAINSITEDELYQHVEVLADDVYEGRSAGSRGGRAAALYVLDQIKPHRMTPGNNGDYAQTFNNNCRNILILLPGDDPRVENEVIVVGAHYDHVGRGKNSNSFGPTGRIHNGADDNASGTSVLLETIEAFATSGLKTRRTILFAFWDAEEMALSARGTGLPIRRCRSNE